jgi:hypothetical protein
VKSTDGRCTCEIKSRTAMAKAAFNKNRALFTNKMDLELRTKLVKCYIWSIALYGAETWTFRAVIRNSWKVLKNVVLVDGEDQLGPSMSRNEGLLKVKEQRNVLHQINGSPTGLVTFCVETAFYNMLLKER